MRFYWQQLHRKLMPWHQSGIPPQEQSLSVGGRPLSDPKATLASFNIGEDAVLLLRRKVTVAGRCVGALLSSAFSLTDFLEDPRNRTRR